jgi:hypothetical protein
MTLMTLMTIHNGERSAHPSKELTKTTHQVPEDVVRHVAGGVAERPGSTVGKNDGRRRYEEGIPHRPDGHVGKVDEHPQAVELANHSLAEAREPVAVEAQGHEVLVRVVGDSRVSPGSAMEFQHSQLRPRANSFPLYTLISIKCANTIGLLCELRTKLGSARESYWLAKSLTLSRLIVILQSYLIQAFSHFLLV